MKKMMFLLLLAMAILGCTGKTESNQREAAQNDPFRDSIEAFLKTSNDMGTFAHSADMDDWANGKRLVITTTKGEYIFYFYNTDVADVWEINKDKPREQIFHKDLPELPGDVAIEAVGELPAYTIIAQYDWGSRGKFGAVLITSFSKNTPAEMVEKTAKGIAVENGFTEVELYCTQEAYKANYDDSYYKAHPDALDKGYLGSLKGGVLSPTD